MTRDLFSAGDEILDRIPLQDAEVYYQPQLELGRPADAILRELIAATPWRAENIVLFGKTYAQPRLIAWYGDGLAYTYSCIHLIPLAWTPLLLELKKRVELVTHSAFNSVLLNYYRDHRDSMGFHSDDEHELGDQPVIASLSLGEQRTFIFKHKKDKRLKPVRLKLASGSLLIMRGQTQRYWKHGIDKESQPCGARINLTFRQINS